MKREGIKLLIFPAAIFVMGSSMVVWIQCTAKTTGVDASDKQKIAGPTGDPTAEGGSQIWQFTTGNIAIGGGWLAAALLPFTLLVARRRRLAVQRFNDMLRISRNAEALKVCEHVIAQVDARGWRRTCDGEPKLNHEGRPKLDAPGRVIARSVKRMTKKKE